MAGCPQGHWNRVCARAGGSYRGGADCVESVARGRGTRVGRKVAASTTGCWSCGTARRSRALRKEKVGLCRQLMTSPPLELTNTPPTADNTRGTTAHSVLPGKKRREIGVRSGIKRPIVDLNAVGRCAQVYSKRTFYVFLAAAKSVSSTNLRFQVKSVLITSVDVAPKFPSANSKQISRSTQGMD